MDFSASGRVQHAHTCAWLGSSRDQLPRLHFYLSLITCCYNNQGKCNHSCVGREDVCGAARPEQGGHGCLVTLTPASAA